MAGLSIKLYRDKILACLVGLLFVVVPFLLLAIKTLYRGRSVWSPKSRPNPPVHLSYPQYGSHHYIKLKNIRLHYVEAGDRKKPLVIFLHGFPEFWYSWRHQIKALKQSYWTVAVDMRGYGDSDKPSGVKFYDHGLLVEDVKQLIQSLGRSSCILIAHDWGGVVGYLMAKRYPQMIEKMVILNAPHPLALFAIRRRSLKQFFKSWYIYFFQIPFLPEILMLTEDVIIFDKIFRVPSKGKGFVADDDMEAFKYTFSSRAKWNGPINYYRRLFDNRYEVKKDLSGLISVPTLIIWGCNDLALENGLAQLSCNYFTTCSVKYVESGGHFVQQDSAPIVNQYIETFLSDDD